MAGNYAILYAVSIFLFLRATRRIDKDRKDSINKAA